MASVVFDRRRGTYAIQWFDGKRWTRTRACTLPRWTAGAARPKRHPIEVDRALVLYRERERRAKAGGAPVPDRTVEEFLAAHRASCAVDRAPNTLRVLDQATRSFLAWCRARGLRCVEEVTPAACVAWIEHRSQEISPASGRRIHPTTVRTHRGLLSAAWAQAVLRGELPQNPWAAAPPPGRTRKGRRARRPSWTPEEYRRLRLAAPPWLRDVLDVGCHAGLRVAALLGLEWRDVRLDGDGPGELAVRPELDKAGVGYRVPLHPTARAVLERRRRTAEGPLVLTGRRGQAISPAVAANAILAACHRAGLVKPISPTHHMRRSFGRWAVLGHLTGRPVPLYVVSRWMGHASVNQTSLYLDLRMEESAGWMTVVDQSPQASSGQDRDSR